MPIYVYQRNKQISTNAIRNNKVVKAIYAKEQGQDAVCVWGADFTSLLFTYTVQNNSVTITGLNPNNQFSGNLSIPNKIKGKLVTSIGDRAFYSCTSLTNITIPDSVKYIGKQVFYGCTGLTSITIPNGVTSIGLDAFHGCTGLTSVTIPNSVTNIGKDAFYNTAWYNNQPDGLVYAGKVAYKYKGTMPSNTSIVLNEGTLGIAGSAFKSCTGLTSVTIPNGVTSIGPQVFFRCSGLTSITFNGTREQWNVISKGNQWDYNTGNYTIHCTDGDIPK